MEHQQQSVNQFSAAILQESVKCEVDCYAWCVSKMDLKEIQVYLTVLGRGASNVWCSHYLIFNFNVYPILILVFTSLIFTVNIIVL